MEYGNSSRWQFDYLVVGSGLAGLTAANQLAASGGSVAVITKRDSLEGNTRYAQGGIACVVDSEDSFDEHVADTMTAGAGLCDEAVVRRIVESGPAAVRRLIALGTHFTTRGELGEHGRENDFDLGKEGGHHRRRVLHSGDITGEELANSVYAACRGHDNISFFEHHIAVDLITSERLGWIGGNHCLGAYVLDIRGDRMLTILAGATIVATGGAGKVYLYTSNPDVACGGGVAMCYRANVPIVNMEFFQFHPTILYHPDVRSFLISEAVRGEGAILKRSDGKGGHTGFMDAYHEMGALAPRDVVARAIDKELKKHGLDCAYLDIRHRGRGFLVKRFPNIYRKCLECGIDMAADLIPVVPAAHYSCGGVKTDVNGFTGINGLYAAGEVACTGLHGANRLASNSLLEALVVGGLAADHILANTAELAVRRPTGTVPDWSSGEASDSDEQVVISHSWDEVRRFMWDYVGIFRTNKRLERAKTRIRNIRKEIRKYYWDSLINSDLVELRNIATVAEIIIDSAMSRHESRGLHYNSDYPKSDSDLEGVETVIRNPKA